MVEDEQGIVAGAAEVAVEGGSLLPAVGLADRAVHVHRQIGQLAVPASVIDPSTGEVYQPVQVGRGGERPGLEVGDFACGGRRVLSGLTAHDGPHGGVEAKLLRR
jgi:hypothetical protein